MLEQSEIAEWRRRMKHIGWDHLRIDETDSHKVLKNFETDVLAAKAARTRKQS